MVINTYKWQQDTDLIDLNVERILVFSSLGVRPIKEMSSTKSKAGLY